MGLTVDRHGVGGRVLVLETGHFAAVGAGQVGRRPQDAQRPVALVRVVGGAVRQVQST